MTASDLPSNETGKTDESADADKADAASTANGDVAAFERIYHRHSARVYALARWLGNPQDADDLTQEVFLIVWRRSGSYDGRAAFSTWLRTVTVHAILAKRRTHSFRMDQASESLDLHDSARLSSSLNPDEQMTFDTAIEKLPEPIRQVFVLHDVEGYKHEEIANLLGINSGTSASRLHRARTILRGVVR